jgi:hypothetical protein
MLQHAPGDVSYARTESTFAPTGFDFFLDPSKCHTFVECCRACVQVFDIWYRPQVAVFLLLCSTTPSSAANILHFQCSAILISHSHSSFRSLQSPNGTTFGVWPQLQTLASRVLPFRQRLSRVSTIASAPDFNNVMMSLSSFNPST